MADERLDMYAPEYPLTDAEIDDAVNLIISLVLELGKRSPVTASGLFLTTWIQFAGRTNAPLIVLRTAAAQLLDEAADIEGN